MGKKTRNSVRATKVKGITPVSISLPEELVAKIDRMAAAQNRNRSNFIAVVMKELAESR